MRCMPQVHGAVRDALDYCLRVFEIEMNSAVDNPLVFVAPKQPGKKDANSTLGEIISGGNFHGEPIAFALDFLAIALSALAGISERRIERLVNPSLNEGLPPFLAGGAGLVPRNAGAEAGPAAMTLLQRVSSALGASMGATRVVTDAGWVGFERQIGTTGVTIDPDLYVAFGISGASQHTGGLGAPTHIVSVNIDPSCPMTAMADLGLVTDAGELLRVLAGRLGIEVPGVTDGKEETNA